jgi:hypothetical protein
VAPTPKYRSTENQLRNEIGDADAAKTRVEPIAEAQAQGDCEGDPEEDQIESLQGGTGVVEADCSAH